jgi:3-oxoacyl-[acyl-carrier-protein] synthase-1
MIAIQDAGTITPVGLGLTDTIASLYTRVQLFTDLDVLDSDGEPVSGMKIPFPDTLDFSERIITIANAVVDQATLAIEPTQKVPLFLCCPEPSAIGQDPTAFPAQLLNAVIAKAVIPIDPKSSRIIARGRSGLLEALGAALALLKDPSIPYCLVGGIDSFIGADRLQTLLNEDRLLTETVKDGYHPGEAGALLPKSSWATAPEERSTRGCGSSCLRKGCSQCFRSTRRGWGWATSTRSSPLFPTGSIGASKSFGPRRHR